MRNVKLLVKGCAKIRQNLIGFIVVKDDEMGAKGIFRRAHGPDMQVMHARHPSAAGKKILNLGEVNSFRNSIHGKSEGLGKKSPGTRRDEDRNE